MPNADTGKTRYPLGLAALLSILLPVLLLARLGQDANWDLRNYHLYNAHAWLHGRYAIDVAPAQLQSWHNPLLDVPLYLLAQSGGSGLLTSSWLMLPIVIALFCLLRLPRCLGISLSATGSFALAATAVTGVAAFSALGSSFNDGFVAAGLMLSIYLLLGGESVEPTATRIFFAGLVAGMTTGLKLTSAPYCLALAAMALPLGARSTGARRLAILLAGGSLGLILTYGYWGWMLWQWHGNPFFPYLNQLFRSPDALPLSYGDLRFRPRSLTDAALVPVRLLFNSQRYSEPTIRDPRLLLGVSAFVFLLWRRRRAATQVGFNLRPRFLALTFFFAVGLALWALLYGIYRYALPLELLACLGLILAIETTVTRFRRLALLASSLLVIASTHHAHWGRTEFRRPMMSISLPELPPNSLIVTGSLLPVSYAALGVPDGVPILSFYNNFMRPDRCSRMQADLESRIASHDGPIWLLRGAGASADEGQQMAEDFYGLSVTNGCLAVRASLGDLSLCRVQRKPRSSVCARSLVSPGR